MVVNKKSNVNAFLNCIVVEKEVANVVQHIEDRSDCRLLLTLQTEGADVEGVPGVNVGQA